MRRLVVGSLCLGLAFGGGCKNRNGNDDGGGGAGQGGQLGTGGAGGGGGAANETAAAETASDTTSTLQEALAVVDTLFAFDPDLDPNGTDTSNQDTIRSNAMTDGGACVNVTLVAGGLKVDWGAGCTLPSSGIMVQGAITVTLQKMDTGPLVVTLAFDAFVADGFDLDGTAAFSTTNGSAFGVMLDLTHASTTFAGNINVTGAPTGITIDGDMTVDDGSTTFDLAMESVGFVPGDCYPNAGDVGVTLGALHETLTFSSTTPTTGQASLQGPLGMPQCYELRPHGSCMPQACAG